MTILLCNEDSSGDIDGRYVLPGNVVCLALTPRP